MSLYPMFSDLKGLPVLVVGGGSVAARKVRSLLESEADVHVGAPRLTPELSQGAREGRIKHIRGTFLPDWLNGMWLVIVATGDRSTNAKVAALAVRRRIFANVVDDPVLSRFQVPAVVQWPPMVVAVSTGGAAPAIARRVREILEAQLDQALGPLVALADRHRRDIRSQRPDLVSRRHFYDWLYDGPVMAAVRGGRIREAERHLVDQLHERATAVGHVSIVGAGPGDPSLLTLAALHRLHQADVILHDRLVTDATLAFARREAERVDVGKRCGHTSTSQEHINALMRTHALAGRHVVRLKGGDPFVFGRGGEEVEFLRHHGISHDVVPGITAAIGCAAYAGIPLTHRDHAQSVRLVTAHCSDSLDMLDGHDLAGKRQTLVFYMGVSQLERLAGRLIEHGVEPAMPCVFVENGTLPSQRVLHGQLQQMVALSRQHRITSPALLIVGEVVRVATSVPPKASTSHEEIYI